jgi:hypothetical protein
MKKAVKNWWWEPGVNRSEKMYAELRDCFGELVGFSEADGVQFEGQARESKRLERVAARGE